MKRQWITAQQPYRNGGQHHTRAVRLYIDRDATELDFNTDQGTARVHVLRWVAELGRWNRYPDIVLADSITHLGVTTTGSEYDPYHNPFPASEARYATLVLTSPTDDVRTAAEYWERRARAGSAYDYGERYAALARAELARRFAAQSRGARGVDGDQIILDEALALLDDEVGR